MVRVGGVSLSVVRLLVVLATLAAVASAGGGWSWEGMLF
jgi:hypothetical protein